MEKKLLYCWMEGGLKVLVPKHRGSGFLKTPYGNHQSEDLTVIVKTAFLSVFGLSGSLEFACDKSVYHGGSTARAAFVAKIIPSLEGHYGFKSVEIEQTEFWNKHPLAVVVKPRPRKDNHVF